MENRITLTADNKDELNRQIDLKLKSGYLLVGGMYAGENEKISQKMKLSNNIDSEITPLGMIKVAIGTVIYVSVLYFVL